MEDGSPVDRLFSLGLLVIGVGVLVRRGVRFETVFRENAWVILFLAYGLVSIVWSDFPFVAFKRWIKVLGHPVMILIVLTERDRMGAVVALLNRCAYILIPVSVLYIKYYPELGRAFDMWSGRGLNTGVTTDKNALGYICMVFGFAFIWQIMVAWKTPRSAAKRDQLIVCCVILAMILWLLKIADAKTALVTFLLSACLGILLGAQFIRKEYLGTYIVVGLVVVTTMQLSFGVYEKVIVMLGRDPTLTDRTYVWADVLAMDNDPIVGAGFESFWLGERLEKMWDKYWWRPNQAHNGYIETYLNLGWLGLILFGGLILSTFRKIQQTMIVDLDVGRFRMPLLLAILVFNYTDAIFKALHPLWFAFYLIAMDYPQRSSPLVNNSEVSDEADDELPASAEAPI